jgi:hypothetical protein
MAEEDRMTTTGELTPDCCVATVRRALERQAARDLEAGRPLTLARHTDDGRRRIAAAIVRSNRPR